MQSIHLPATSCAVFAVTSNFINTYWKNEPLGDRFKCQLHLSLNFFWLSMNI